MTRNYTRKLIPVERYEDLPTFDSEAEEAQFWSTHKLGQALRAESRPAADDPELPPVRAKSVIRPRRRARPLLTIAKEQARAQRRPLRDYLRHLIRVGLKSEANSLTQMMRSHAEDTASS